MFKRKRNLVPKRPKRKGLNPDKRYTGTIKVIKQAKLINAHQRRRSNLEIAKEMAKIQAQIDNEVAHLKSINAEMKLKSQLKEEQVE